MDANSGAPWSEMDIADLTHSLDYGDTFAQTASFLCRDEDEVREKMKELRLTEQPGRTARRPLKIPHIAITSAMKITTVKATAPRCSSLSRARGVNYAARLSGRLREAPTAQNF